MHYSNVEEKIVYFELRLKVFGSALSASGASVVRLSHHPLVLLLVVRKYQIAHHHLITPHTFSYSMATHNPHPHRSVHSPQLIRPSSYLFRLITGRRSSLGMQRGRKERKRGMRAGRPARRLCA